MTRPTSWVDSTAMPTPRPASVTMPSSWSSTPDPVGPGADSRGIVRSRRISSSEPRLTAPTAKRTKDVATPDSSLDSSFRGRLDERRIWVPWVRLRAPARLRRLTGIPSGLSAWRAPAGAEPRLPLDESLPGKVSRSSSCRAGAPMRRCRRSPTHRGRREPRAVRRRSRAGGGRDAVSRVARSKGLSNHS